MSAAVPSTEPTQSVDNLTDGFHLLIDALKINGVKTIYNVPGIPITDLGRYAQAQGLRVLSFRHEQHAGYAAAAAGFLTKKPGICMTVSAPGFLNGLTALAHATTNCWPMILISGSSEREIVDLQRGDYEEMDQLAIARPHCKAAYRILHAEDIGLGVARAIRAALTGRPGGVYLDIPGQLLGQVMDAVEGQKSLIEVVDPNPASVPSPEAISRAVDVLKSAKKPLIILGALYLAFTKIADWRIMFSMVVGAVVMALLLNTWGATPFMQVPWYYQFYMGSFWFAMAFMATDPVTASGTPTGKWIYGFLIGFIGMIIRVLNPAYPEGWMLAILFMNVFAPLIDHYVYQANISRRLKKARAVA